MSTRLHNIRFTLPLATNAGLSTEHARKAWEAEALKMAGGYTLHPFADGAWRNEEGRTFKERVACYDVACFPDVRAFLEGAFWRLFPDQEALAVFDLGEARITSRPAEPAAA